MFGFGNKKKPEKMKKRRSTIKNLGQKHNELDTEEQRELHRLGEYKRAEVEMPGIRQRRRQERFPLLKPRIRRSRRKTPTNRTKRNTSLKSLRGKEDKFHNYRSYREGDSDLRPIDLEGHLIIPPPPSPTVRMRIDDFEKASQGLGNHMGGKTRKRRRKRRRKTKRKGRRKTKKRRKMRKRKTRRKR